MMAKMYYSVEEAAEKLGISQEELAGLVEQGQLMVYADGANKVYRADEVDALAGPAEAEPAGTVEEAEEVELTPAGDEDVVTLSEAEEAPTPGKDDTVITSEGISIFDDEDLEVESADPMAKTSLAPSVEDQISLEGVGSGSGLLDLTRESDDTSLGAEVLDHIDAEAAIPSSAGVEEAIAEVPYGEPEPVVVEAPTVVEEVDPTSGAFSGLIVAAALIMLVAAAVALATMLGIVPAYVEALQENILIFLAASVVVGVIAAVIGFVLGKSVAARAEALQRSEM